MRIAIVHDYLHQYGGAEKVVETWLEMYPHADVYTSFSTEGIFNSSTIFDLAKKEGRIHTTWLQLVMPTLIRFYKHLFWLYPIIMSFVVVKKYDVVLISSTYCAKNVRYKGCGKLIHYCHSPVRFLHGLVTETDHKTINPILKSFIPLFIAPLRWMDNRAVGYLNRHKCIWISNSQFIQQTIKEVYNTESVVIYPPIDLESYLPIERKPNTQKPFYICHGRISFHKRLDIAIEACLRSGRRLVISGASALPKELNTLKEIIHTYEAKNPSSQHLITFLGRTTDEQLLELMAEAQGFIFPGKEDFGITPIEMLAAGLPLIAYKAGGALEYVNDGVNGIFFDEQSVDHLIQALDRYETITWDTKIIKLTSKPFAKNIFQNRIHELVSLC